MDIDADAHRSVASAIQAALRSAMTNVAGMEAEEAAILSTTSLTKKRSHDEIAPPPPAPAKRAVGGFVDDDSDDEDEDSATPAGSTSPGEPAESTSSRSSPPDAPPPTKKRMLAAPDSEEIPNTQGEHASLAPEGDNSAPVDDDDIPDAQIRSQIAIDDNEEPPEENEEDRYDLLFRASQSALPSTASQSLLVQTCAGRAIPVRQRATPRAAVPYEAMVAQRSRTKEGRAQRSFYGIAIHELVDGARGELAAQEAAQKEKNAAAAENGAAAQIEKDAAAATAAAAAAAATTTGRRRPKRTMLWTEKYRARSFMDLVGDDLTNRLVLRWLKRWEPLVFPHAARGKKVSHGGHGVHGAPGASDDEKPHRKILILAGPPGLGKTTLAHVCARQAGYEVLEINASDDRSRDVVNGRIRTSLGTESVKTVEQSATNSKSKVARPVCVVVDEVDGVVGGSGSGGEGGFVKALIDLVLLDQKNGSGLGHAQAAPRKKKRGDDFRQMRPLVLICNDVYHASLRPLRLSGFAEIVHVGKPTVETVVARLKSIFEKEGIPCEKEAARKLCEAAWGMSTGGGGEAARRGTESTAEGDLRGVMVVGEWVARRLRATTGSSSTTTGPPPQLTRLWVEQHVLPDLAYGGGGGGGGGVGARGLGRGGAREIVTRIFQEGAGFPKTAGASSSSALGTSAATSYRHEQPKEQMSFAENQQRYALGRLREMIETSGDVDRIMGDIFAEYPNREFNDDSYLSKPDAAYEWMHFHDACAHRVFGSQEWELAPYTSQPVLACHQLFATSRRHVPEADHNNSKSSAEAPPPLPFTGPRADFMAREAEKHNRAALQAIQAHLPPSLLRAFRNAEDVAADLLPYVVRLVSPDVKPVLVNVASSGGDKNSGYSGPTSVASVRREGEKVLVRRAAAVLAELGIKLQRGILEEAPSALPARPQWVYRMEPDLDMLASFETAGPLLLAGSAPTRYAVRQVLDQELRKTLAARDNAARQARFHAGHPLGGHEVLADADKENSGRAKKEKAAMVAIDAVAVKRDFFGRIVVTNTVAATPLQETDGNAGPRGGGDDGGSRSWANACGDKAQRVWVTFHEGLNNAVRKPISVDEFLRGL